MDIKVNSDKDQQINMILSQLRTSGLLDDKTLKAFDNHPRSKFFPENLQNVAYLDDHIKLDENIYQISATLFGQMLSNLDIKPTEKVLEIGSATGFNAIILSQISSSVDSIFQDASLVANAKNYSNIHNIKNCSFHTEVPLNRKYDVVIISGGIKSFDPYIKYLEDNGRAIAVILNHDPIGKYLPLGNLCLFSKNGLGCSSKLLFTTNIFNIEK